MSREEPYSFVAGRSLHEIREAPDAARCGRQVIQTALPAFCRRSLNSLFNGEKPTGISMLEQFWLAEAAAERAYRLRPVAVFVRGSDLPLVRT